MSVRVAYTVPNNIAIVMSTLHMFPLSQVPPGVPFRLMDNFAARRYYRYSDFVQSGNVYRCINYDSTDGYIVRSITPERDVFVEEEYLLQCLKPNGVQLNLL